MERGGQGKEGQGGRDGAGRGRSTVSTAWPVHLEEARPCPGQCPPPPGTPSAMPRQPARCLEGGRRGAGDSPPPPGRSLLRGSAPSLGSAPAPHPHTHLLGRGFRAALSYCSHTFYLYPFVFSREPHRIHFIFFPYSCKSGFSCIIHDLWIPRNMQPIRQGGEMTSELCQTPVGASGIRSQLTFLT